MERHGIHNTLKIMCVSDADVIHRKHSAILYVFILDFHSINFAVSLNFALAIIFVSIQFLIYTSQVYYTGNLVVSNLKTTMLTPQVQNLLLVPNHHCCRINIFSSPDRFIVTKQPEHT